MTVTIDEVTENLKFWAETNDVCRRTNENIIAFIGPTKGGKSTLINCLMKKKLICQLSTETEEFFITKEDQNQIDGGPKIGNDAESESFKPECYENFLRTDLIMWDFPGFGDNKGVKQEVANAISIKTVLCQQNSVRFILVVPFDVIKHADPFEFFRLLNNILSISPNIANHLILVASKMHAGNLEAILKKLMNTPFPNADVEILNLMQKAQSVIAILLKNDAFIEFKAPIGVKDQDPYIFPNEDNFRKCLEDSEGINISNSYLVLSDKAKLDMIELYDTIYCSLRLKINDIVEDIRTKAAEDLEIFRRSARTGAEMMEYCNRKINEYNNFNSGTQLNDFLMCFGSLERRRNALELGKNFANLEKLRNDCCSNEVQGAQEFILVLKNELNNVILRLNEEVQRVNPDIDLVTAEQRTIMSNVQNDATNLTSTNILNVCNQIFNFLSLNWRSIQRLINMFSQPNRRRRR